MPGTLPFAAPTVLDYFASLVADDSSLPLLEAAVALAQDENAGLDVQGVLARVDALADRLRKRIPADMAPLSRLRLLNRYFFEELGFAGNVNHYDDPSNSLLPAVLETRRGIPISLAVLYIEFATQIGLRAQGVSFPGHFLVKIAMPRGEVVLDPFTGHSLSREELEERLAPYLRQHGLVGDNEVPLGLFLQAAPARDVVARMLRNLVEIHRRSGDTQRLIQVLERMVIVLPQAWEEQRDLALALADAGQHAAAAAALTLYLDNRPAAEDAAPLRRRLNAWRRLM
jgi:regulator of sirC expression with transglutaminase-like and TPR domain